MILPSDSDPPPDRNDGKDPDPAPWWEDPSLSEPDDDEETDSDEEEEDEDADPEDLSWLGDPNDPNGPEPPPGLQSLAGPGWRQDLYKDLVESLRDLEAIEDPDDEFTPPEPPDLFTFFGELAALRNELRLQGQRSNDSLSQLEKTLTPLLRPANKSSKTPAPKSPGAWPVETCLALLNAWDLLPQASSPTAFGTSFQPLFQAAGLTRIPALGLPFDSATMTRADTAPAPKNTPPGTVLKELQSGFLHEGQLLRPALVITTE